MTNSMMIMELVNAGCDLRKLSPEFLEKLCGVYEGKGTSSTPTPAAPAPSKRVYKGDIIENLTIGKNNMNKTHRCYVNELIDDIEWERFNSSIFRFHLENVRRFDDNENIRTGLTLLSDYMVQKK